MAIDESTLTKGQLRKLAALRRYVGDELGEEAFGKLLAQRAEVAQAKVDPVADKIEMALAAVAGGRAFNLGNYGYLVQRALGKGASGFVATKNGKP